jgi:hypothetical protein
VNFQNSLNGRKESGAGSQRTTNLSNNLGMSNGATYSKSPTLNTNDLYNRINPNLIQDGGRSINLDSG